MRPNLNLMKATLTGALGGLLFGFDTVVISGIIDAVVKLYGLSDYGKGWTVAIALIGTVVGSFSAGVVGHKLGSRETLRLTAVLYIVSALGSALAWNWPSSDGLPIYRWAGNRRVVSAGPGVHRRACSGQVARAAGGRVSVQRGLRHPGCVHLELPDPPAASGRDRVALAGGRGGGSGAGISGMLLFGIPRSPRWSASRDRIDEALEVLKLMGEPEPEAELADIRKALAEEHASAHEPVFRWKYRYPLFLAITIGAFNQLAGINAILYYLNDIFQAAGFSQLSGDQQAIAIGFTNLIFTMIGMSMIDKAGPQDAAADWCGGYSRPAWRAWRGSIAATRTRACWCGC